MLLHRLFKPAIYDKSRLNIPINSAADDNDLVANVPIPMVALVAVLLKTSKT